MKFVGLDSVCEILDSKRVPITASNRVPGPYPYYGANGVQDYVNNFIFDDELVLLAEDGGNFSSKDKTIAYRVSGKCWVNNHAHVLKPKADIDVDYLCYALMFYDVSKLINGATRQKLTQTDMKKIQIPWVEKIEQQKIVRILGIIFSLIQQKKWQLEKLDDFVKSRFVEMFGNGYQNCISIDQICSIITDGTHQSPKFSEEGIPFLFVSNIISDSICYDTDKFIDEETYKILMKRTPIELGDILLSIVGSYGHPAIVKSNKKFCFQRHIAYLKPKRSLVNSIYLHGAILSDEVQRQIERNVKGIAQKTLNLSEVKKIRVPLPNIKLQNEFADFVKQVDKSKYVSTLFLQNLLLYKKSAKGLG